MSVTVRREKATDIAAIHELNVAAFDGRDEEADLVDALRDAGDLVLSLVAVDEAGGTCSIASEIIALVAQAGVALKAPPVRVIAPIILGHEVAGIIEAVGAEVQALAVGDRVAVSPSQPCFDCAYCARRRERVS